MRKCGLAALMCACLGVTGLLVSGAAASAPKFKLKISSIESNTAGNHKHRVTTGKVTSCASDPTFAVTFFYKWSGASFGRKYRIVLKQPAGRNQDFTAKWFAKSGTNADLTSAEEQSPGTKALAPGRYTFRISSQGVSRHATVDVSAKDC